MPHENTSLLLLVESEKCTFLFFVTPFTFYYEVLKHPCWRDAVLSSISSWTLLGQTWCFRFLLAYFTPEYIFVNGEWKVHFAMFLVTPFIVKCLSIFLLYKRHYGRTNFARILFCFNRNAARICVPTFWERAKIVMSQFLYWILFPFGFRYYYSHCRSI